MCSYSSSLCEQVKPSIGQSEQGDEDTVFLCKTPGLKACPFGYFQLVVFSLFYVNNPSLKKIFRCKVVKNKWLAVELFFILRKIKNALIVMSIPLNTLFMVVMLSSFYNVHFGGNL